VTQKGGNRVRLGAFAGAHGVKGAAQIRTFTERPENIGEYGPVETEDGARRFTLTVIRTLKPGLVLATAPEIKNREDALSLKGQQLFIDRDRLPAPEDDAFYVEDLIGLAARDENGEPLGRIKAVHNFGGGDILELHGVPAIKDGRLIPFTRENAPTIDLEAGFIVIMKAALEDDVDPENSDASGDTRSQ